jgi:ketosteroid isomerase-like protein
MPRKPDSLTEQQRTRFEGLLRELYDARAAGDLERLCALFSEEAMFKISGSSDGKPIAVAALGAGEIRSWLTVLVKAFRFADYEIMSKILDGSRAAVHWRADIHSRITGLSVPTQLVDLLEEREGRIVSFVELFVPA